MKKDIRTERANLFEPDVYISMVVKITGNVSKEAVRHAVENAYRANEATMSEIVLTISTFQDILTVSRKA